MYEIKKWCEVLTIISGKDQKDIENPSGKYPIYGSGGVIGRADKYLCEENTVIVGRKGTINNPIFVDEPFWNIDTAFGIVAGKELLPKFLFYFCKLFNFTTLDKSTGRPSISKSDLLKIEMPVPPLYEQARIVSRIEELFSELDAGVETLRKTQRQLETYRQAVLKEAFSELDERVTMASICDSISDGDHMPPPKSQTGIPFIMISNIENNTILWNDTAYVGQDYYDSIDKKRKPQRGDVLYTVTGSYGIPVLIDFDIEFCFQRHIALLRPSEKVLQKYLYYALMEPSVYSQASDKATGTAQKTVGLAVLRNITIPFTSEKKLQKKIVYDVENKLSVCNNIEKTITASLQQAEALRQSILKQAFEGKL